MEAFVSICLISVAARDFSHSIVAATDAADVE